MENSDIKICKLINDNFCWRLVVDGEDIHFNGASNALYFEKHYESLGYKVEIINDYWKNETV